MLRVFAILASLFLAAPLAIADPDVSAENEQSTDVQLAAVLLYADWCGSCHILDPKVKAVRENEIFDNTKFVILDFTKRDAESFFAQADAAEIGAPVRAYLGDTVKTGLLLLVDLDEGKVVQTLTKELSEADIIAAIRAWEDLV